MGKSYHHHHSYHNHTTIASTAATKTTFTCLAVLLILLIAAADLTSAQYHPECGESPVQKYREMAKARGWNWGMYVKLMKTERSWEFERLLKAVALYAECLQMSKFPLYR